MFTGPGQHRKYNSRQLLQRSGVQGVRDHTQLGTTCKMLVEGLGQLAQELRQTWADGCSPSEHSASLSARPFLQPPASLTIWNQIPAAALFIA